MFKLGIQLAQDLFCLFTLGNLRHEEAKVKDSVKKY